MGVRGMDVTLRDKPISTEATAGIRPYPAYKPSGVPWLGDVPAHWAIRRLKSLVSNITEQQPARDASDQICITMAAVESWTGHIVLPKDRVVLDSQVKRFRTGDVLFGKLRPYLAKVTRPAFDGVCVGEFLVLRARDPGIAAEYLEKTLRSVQAIHWINSMTDGARMPRVEWESMAPLPFPVPPPDEQAAIVRYLDAVDRLIRRYIRAKRRLIDLLTEQKQAIIHQAVTQGLDPSAPRKPSGVEWYGDIPTHWNLVPIKRLFSRMDYGISESSGDEGRYRVLTMGNIQNGVVNLANCGLVESVSPLLVLDRHDLLFNRTNSLELVGKVGIFEGDRADNVTFASYLVRMTTNELALPLYLNYLLNSPSVLAIARLNAIPSLHQANLNPTRYGRLPVPVPPMEEQKLLLDFISISCAKLDQALGLARREIDLIREYRTRLIADVVTGQLDVRNAPLPAALAELDGDLDEASEQILSLDAESDLGDELSEELDAEEFAAFVEEEM